MRSLTFPSCAALASTLNATMERMSASASVLICDAGSTEDLAGITAVAANFGNRALWVGSAGLAQHIPQSVALHPDEEIAEVKLPETSGTVLFVIGSASNRTKHQAAVLLSSAAVRGIVVLPEVLLASQRIRNGVRLQKS